MSTFNEIIGRTGFEQELATNYPNVTITLYADSEEEARELAMEHFTETGRDSQGWGKDLVPQEESLDTYEVFKSNIISDETVIGWKAYAMGSLFHTDED